MGGVRKFLGGWLMGLALGGLVALLLAPDTGETTRQRLRQGWKQLWDEVRRAAAEERRRLEEELRKFMEQGGSMTP